MKSRGEWGEVEGESDASLHSSFFSQLCLLSSRGNCRVAQDVNEREKGGERGAKGEVERERVKYDSLTNENCRKSSELWPPLLIVQQLWGFIPAIGRNFFVQSYRADFIPQQDGFLPLSALRLSSTLAESSAAPSPTRSPRSLLHDGARDPSCKMYSIATENLRFRCRIPL